MQYKIKNTNVVFQRHEFGKHFPNTSLPAFLTREDLDSINVEEEPDPEPTVEEVKEAEAKALELQLLQAREQAKAQRAEVVAAIKVTTQAGYVFDGDEISQGRMTRAVVVLSAGLAPSVPWVLADNSVIDATVEDLMEALALAGKTQAAAWVL